ncbi:thermonuclease family protein [Nonomuraea antri]|uniref:thermonuclease family protein n=1 Tax=Nonomuraea antri TaxID=2730852 RepID=UPI001F18B97C|nr:excalibur calcium-binding domain-containing protein [Nonomuraea antri]
MRLRAISTATAAGALLCLTVATPVSAAPSGIPKGAVKAKVVKIVDGNTVDVLRGGKKYRVRLLEVATPRRGACWYKAAIARTGALLPVDSTVHLLADEQRKDANGRWLFYAFNAKGVHVNRNLVRYGFGKAVLVEPNDQYIKVMRSEEAKARKERLRIWSGKCDGGGKNPTPQPTPSPTSSDSPDDDSPNGDAPDSGSPDGNGGTDPRFPTCAAANAAGYGPYIRGVDPEYSWYQDRDGDGRVCER